MSRRLDLTGAAFGRLEVLEEVAAVNSRVRRWKCRCSCGGIAVVDQRDLRNRIVSSCLACDTVTSAPPPKVVNPGYAIKVARGDIFGHLVVIREAARHWGGWRQVNVKCVCGKKKDVSLRSLVTGVTKSCGCRRASRHGQRKSPEWSTWEKIKRRCEVVTDRSWATHGGAGIKMDPSWVESFEKFLEDVGPRPSDDHHLQRVDKDLHFQPGNVQWTRSPRAQVRSGPVGAESSQPWTWRGKERKSRDGR